MDFYRLKAKKSEAQDDSTLNDKHTAIQKPKFQIPICMVLRHQREMNINYYINIFVMDYIIMAQ